MEEKVEILNTLNEYDDLIRNVKTDYSFFHNQFKSKIELALKYDENLNRKRNLNKTAKNISFEIESIINIKGNKNFNSILKILWSLSSINENIWKISNMKEQLFYFLHSLKERILPLNQVQAILSILINLSQTVHGKAFLFSHSQELNSVLDCYSLYDTTKEEAIKLKHALNKEIYK